MLVAAQVENGRVRPEDFQTLSGLHHLTLDLYPNRSGLGLVRLYYKVIEGLDVFLVKIPAFTVWSQSERVICARYAAVQVDRRLQANLDLAASLYTC